MNSKLAIKSNEIKNNIINFAPREILFKFLVLGDFGVGKTSIVRRYAEGKYSQNYKMTIGAEFALKKISWDNNTRINLQLWDIAGHERFGYLTRVYYKYAVAAAVVFDVSRIETYQSVDKWLSDLRSKVVLPNGKPIPVILLANKGDVATANLPVNDIAELCKKHDILAWFITSAKENSNIDEGMSFLLKKVMENKENEQSNRSDNIHLNTEKTAEKKKKSTCCG